MTSIVKQVNVYAIVRDSGTPLYKASIWIGEAGEDPEYSPKRVWFVQEEGQQFEGKQPIITGVGGFPFFEGDKVAIKVEGDFSIRIRDFSGAVTYESLSGNNVTFDDGDAVPTLADLQEVDTSNFIGDEIYYVAETTEGEVDGFHVIFRNSDKSAEVAANPEQWVIPNDRAGDGSEGAYQKIITGIVPLYQPRQTGDGVTTSFASPATGNQNTKSFNVVVGGVTLTPGEDFTYNSGTGNVDLDSAPANGVDVDVSFFEPNTLITAPTDAADINYPTESNTVKDALDARPATVATLGELQALGTGLTAGSAQRWYNGLPFTLRNDQDYSAHISADGVGYFVSTTLSATAAWVADISGGLNLTKFGWDLTSSTDGSAALVKAIALQNILHSDGYGIDIDGGDLQLNSVVDIDNGVHPALNFTGNTNVIVNNATAGFRIGNTAAAQLDISGQHPVFKQGASGAGSVGILAIRGSFDLPGLRGFDTDNYILHANAASANAITNSTIGRCKFTGCGGIRLENPTRGSLEVTIGDINASNCTKEVFSAENCTDVTTGNIIGDTEAAFAGDCIVVHNCGSFHTGDWLVTARNGRPWAIIGNTDANNDTTSGSTFGALSSFASTQPGRINCKRSHIETIISRNAKTGGVVLGSFCEGNKIDAIILVDGSVDAGSAALDIDTTYINHIGTVNCESANDTSSIDISSGSNQIGIDVIEKMVATAGSSWANGNRPKYLGDSLAPSYVYRNQNNSQTITGSGTGPFNIAHGLAGTPKRFNVMCTDNAIAYRVSANATNLQVTFASSVTNPTFTWEAKVF